MSDQDYKPDSIKILNGMKPPVRHPDAYMPEAHPTSPEREIERKIDELWCESYLVVGTDELGEKMMFKQDVIDCMREIAKLARRHVLADAIEAGRENNKERMKYHAATCRGGKHIACNCIDRVDEIDHFLSRLRDMKEK